MAEKKKWDDEEEGRKPWEAAPTKKKKKRKKAQRQAVAGPTPGRKGPGSMAEDVIEELTKRNKKLAPYAKTGPGAPKRRK
jgi:hypothetical protein